MATADLLSRQGHDARVQGLHTNEDHNGVEGPPQITSIFGADEFRLYQSEDKALYDVRLALQNGLEDVVSDDPEAHEIFRQKEKLVIERDGVLYIKNFYGWNKCRKQLLVPKTLHRKILQQCHNSPLSGHLGRDRTVERVRESCFWPSMTRRQCLGTQL